MAKFSIEAVEALDYDFRGIPKDEGKGYCTGHGTVPEPSTADLEVYQAKMQEIAGSDPVKALAAQPDTEESRKQLRHVLELTAALCKNSPSAEELEELPPRYKMHFIKWLAGELSNPEA